MKINYKKMFGLIALGFGIYFLNFFISLVFIKWLWPKIANILFPDLVTNGEVITQLSFYDAFWLAIYIGLILTALFGRFLRVDKKTKNKLKKDMIINDNKESD